MLKLVNVVKDYPMKDQEPVHALKGLTVNFRRNEFVAILGPSGCGKTTTLNILGGLDRYTSGDLIIEGKSTKNYKDGEWDTYRNHSIGFVFQSYNLIQHQSVIKNVELALTIGGISKKERKDRALKALEKVGLKGLEKKKPNQLSGGQMQRVAIARALINEPEILLADEPTGALDSETSIQIMDLLKEVSKDCLVIMVTHNSELADAYANRIIKMKDGLLISDSNPYSDEEEANDHKVELEKPIVKSNKGNKKRSSMSFLTATGLSMSNLASKLKRTILVAVAGSIGIIGVSAVLAVSTGVRDYINEMQNDMISQYPISIAETAIDYSTIMNGLNGDDKRKIVEFSKEYEVGLDSLINFLMDKYQDFTSVKTNDINEDLLEFIDQIPVEYTSSINKNYGIDMTNNIFTEWVRNDGIEPTFISLNGLTQMYIAELQTVSGFSEYAAFVDLFTNFMEEIPADEEYVLSQYDVLAGTYPKNANEIVLVVDENQTLTDLVYAQMGFFKENEFINIARKAIEENKENPDIEKINEFSYPTSYTFDEILGKKIKYYPHDDIWSYETKIHPTLQFSATLPISGNDYDLSFDFEHDSVLDSLKGSISTSGYNFPASFNRASGTCDEAHPFEGEWEGVVLTSPISFSVDSSNVILHLSTDSNYSRNGNEVSFVVQYDGNNLTANITYNEALDKFTGSLVHPVMGPIGTIDLSRDGSEIDSENKTLGKWTGTINGTNPLSFSLKENGVITFYFDTPFAYNINDVEVKGYMYSADALSSWQHGEEMKISAILKKKKGVNFGCLGRGVYYTRDLTNKMMEDSRNSLIVAGPNSIQDYIGTSFEKDKPYAAYVTYKYTSYAKGDGADAVPDVEGYSNALNMTLSDSVTSMFSLGVDNYSIDKAYLRSLSGKATKQIQIVENIYDYSFEELPHSISIYPTDFRVKKDLIKYLKQWNSNNPIELEKSGKVLLAEDRQELAYVDSVELIVSVINTMIDVVTVALVSFTSLALVVSCFMIAVITYISTMERVKEIGVIRSLGGRKKDVSRLFVAECLIIGLASGIIGVGITYLISLILNIIISNLGIGINYIAMLRPLVALIMLGLSVLLNVISGLIPSMKASNQDPVAALRSE